MTKALFSLLLVAGTLVTATAQNSNRFPAPLGIDRVLTGTVERSKPSSHHPNARTSRFRLHSDETVYALHGDDSKFKKFLGKRVRIVGHVVGSDVDVRSIELQTKR